jgi:uncharacterized membrane protein
MAPSQRSKTGLRLNRVVLAISRHWLRVALTILSIYVALPIVAPTLMHLGAEGPARAIYTIYSPFCHQFTFRSFFLFGDQPVYPRANAGSSWTPFETYAADIEEFQNFTEADEFTLDWTLTNKSYVGNKEMGYKMALCERDMFIYAALLLGGILYSIPRVRRRLRPIPLWLYVFLGLGPIGLDGFSQLLGYPPFELWPARETLPQFRVLTGFIFGLMTAWLGFPYLDISMQSTRRQVERKLRSAGIKI